MALHNVVLLAVALFALSPMQAGITVRQSDKAKLWQVYHGFGERPLTWRWHESATCAYLTVTCHVERTVIGPVAIQRESGAVSGEYDLASTLGDKAESRIYDVVLADCAGDVELSVRTARIAVLAETFELKKVGRTKVERSSVFAVPYDRAWSESSANAISADMAISMEDGALLSLPLSETDGFALLDMQSVPFGEDRCADIGLLFDKDETWRTSLVLKCASVFIVR